VLGSVDLEDDSLPVMQQEQEVHPEAQKAWALIPRRLGIPLQPHLGQERWQAVDRRSEDPVVVKILHLLAVVDPIDDTYRRQMHKHFSAQESWQTGHLPQQEGNAPPGVRAKWATAAPV
jgi:hypothetical protein